MSEWLSSQGMATARESELVELKWGIAPAWFGSCELAWTDAGISWLNLTPGSGSEKHIEDYWSPEYLQRDDGTAQQFAAEIFSAQPLAKELHLRGTDFQLRVWQALTAIPAGTTVSYGELAEHMGMNRNAARAVGSAVAANRVAVLVPCHRVLPASGGLGGFRWGSMLKQALLDRETGVVGQLSPLAA